MGYRALTHVMRGGQHPVSPGELIPETYRDIDGSEKPVDFERLVELGAAEEEKPKGRAKPEKDEGKGSEKTGE